MRLAELTSGFQWGLVLVTDANSTELIPSCSSAGELVTAADSALVVRVMPDVEGSADVYVVTSEKETLGACVFSGRLKVPSKILKVGDALGERSASVFLDKEDIGVQVFLDEPTSATCVHCCFEGNRRRRRYRGQAGWCRRAAQILVAVAVMH